MCGIRHTPTGRLFLSFFLLPLFLMLLVLESCSPDDKTPGQSRSQTEGITFFDVGAGSVFSDALRDRLRTSLGPDAIAYRNVIDLEFNDRGFLQRHFPALHELNRRLNSPAGERVEHSTVKLMYRFAANKNLPFSYVELVFSDITGKPLFIHIRSRKDLSDILRSLEEKYGQPQVIGQSPDSGRFFFWSDKKNILLVSIIPTWRGDKQSRLVIYYAGNIEDLIAAEEEERRKKTEERRRAGEKIF
jgi:hypothetical protein